MTGTRAPASVPILTVRGLVTLFHTAQGTIRAVDRVSLQARPGEVVGVVGESGSGKTTLGLSLLRLVPRPGRIVEGEILLNGRDLLRLREEEMRHIRGKEIAMIFQNPMRSLHPGFTIGWQLREALRVHHPDVKRREATEQAVDLLTQVGLPDASRRISDYPHQFSGGMQQRVMIAMSLINSPDVLVADEPTTALDVTIQAQILGLLKRLATERGMAIALITHNFGVVSSICERVVVMYAGEAVEEGLVDAVFEEPLHPYTKGLLESLPERGDGARLRAIPGGPPHLEAGVPSGCRFRDRCEYAEDVCLQAPMLVQIKPGRAARCWVSRREGSLPPQPGRGARAFDAEEIPA